MKYKSISVPVIAEQVVFNNICCIKGSLFKKYCIDARYLGGGVSLSMQYGNTVVDSGDWLVEFPNGEIHVVRDYIFKQRFQEVESYTQEEVNNAVSMSKRWSEMGGDCS